MISVGCHLKPDSSRSPWNDMFNMNYLLSSSNFLTAPLYRSVRYRKCCISPFMQPVWKLNILPPQGKDFPPSRSPGSRAGRLVCPFWWQRHSLGHIPLGTHAVCPPQPRQHPCTSAAGFHLPFLPGKGRKERKFHQGGSSAILASMPEILHEMPERF